MTNREHLYRDDLSSRLVHLTRGEDPADAAKAFRSIIKDERLSTYRRRLCFSEAPIAKLSHVLAAGSEMRYKPFGVMVSKSWLFARGGRPVIYQPKEDRKRLPEDMRFLHMDYDPTDLNKRDFTWEREWRIPVSELKLDPAHATLIAPTRAWEAWLRSSLGASAIVMRGYGMGQLSGYKWHFIILENLGIEFPEVPPPPPPGTPP